MTGREKIEAAFSKNGSPEIPAVICYEGIYIRDHWWELTACPWWYRDSPVVEEQFQWRRDAANRTGMDWFAVPSFNPRRERDEVVLEERLDGVYKVNRRDGSRQKLQPPRIGGWGVTCGISSVHVENLPSTTTEVDLAIPDVAEFDVARYVEEGRADVAKRLIDEFGGEKMPVTGVATPMWGLYGQWGFEGMMIMVATRPDLVKYASDRLLRLQLRNVAEAAALGAGVVWLEECMTDMVSPAAFADLNVPYVKAIVDAVRKAGMKSIYYYCGDPSDRYEPIFATGADAVAFEESKKGFTIDIETVADKAAGRCAILGNLDAIGLLKHATDDELAAEIKRQITAGRRNGSRFIMSIGSPVTPETPVARVRRYCQLVRELDS